MVESSNEPFKLTKEVQHKKNSSISTSKNIQKKKTKSQKNSKSISKKKLTRTKKIDHKILSDTNTVKTPSIKKTEKTKKRNYSALLEYFDLPYHYNQTTVKVLAQTPNMLFIYWEISEKDRKSFNDQYGDSFFEHTKPVLKIYNETMNYSFEVEINDFANSWYLPINDSKCNYHIELGRRPIDSTIQIEHHYLPISSSNIIETPNDHILFSPKTTHICFKNVKNNKIEEKEISSFSFQPSLKGLTPIEKLYKEMYPKEWNYFIEKKSTDSQHFFTLPINNPSSWTPSSQFK